jgi:hypothetical protein
MQLDERFAWAGAGPLAAAKLAMLRRRCHRCRSQIPIRSLNMEVE